MAEKNSSWELTVENVAKSVKDVLERSSRCQRVHIEVDVQGGSIPIISYTVDGKIIISKGEMEHESI